MASKDFTVGQRIVLGFGIVLALLLFLGVAAFWGVTGIVNNGQEVIGGNQLDGDLAQKEVDHLVWANKVGSLLTDDKVEGLEVQLDPHQCGFGKWLYGEGRKQAVAQMPSLQSLLVQIEKPHQELHQSAGKIQEAFRRPHQGLDVILANRLADHLHWSATVSRELAEEAGGMYTLQNRIEEAVEVAWGVVSSIEKDPLAGGRQEKELLAHNILSAIRFGPDQKDYIYVLDADCRMIVHPNAALIGQDMCRDKDPEKAQIFKSMMKIAQDSGQGFIAYRWPEPGRELPRPKIASIKAFSPFGWVLGSGLYLDEDNTRLMYRFKQLQEQLPFTLSVQLDPGQCGLGLFLKDPETVRVMDRFPELKQAMTALENPHRRLHESAKTIEKAINDFDIPKALDVYEHQTLPALAEVEDQLAKAIKAEGALQQGYDRARAIYVQETVPALHKVQALLLDLRQEARRNVMSDQVMIDSGQTTQVGVLVIGGIALVLGVVLAWLISRSLIRRLAVVAEAIEANSEQVALAAGEISHASQDLADGASAQAASLEESSSSLEQMSSMTRQNADHADKADQLVAETARMMLQAESSMEEMNQSMDEIAASGRQIGKIIQTIDEIAFQTNLLALNAAVEAARAGEAGSGFAVVADEVRNLAQRAAEAAKNTSGLIESTVQKIDLGGRQVREAKETFEHAAANSKKMEELVGQIAAASKEQSQGVGQISDAVNQMDQITQRNAAAAEESAGASVELRSQAENLSDLVGGLMALVGRTQSEFQNATKRLAGGSRPQALEHRPSKAGHPGTKASIPWDREEE